MCCASLHETVTEKTYPKLAPLRVDNPYFLYAPYFPIVPQQLRSPFLFGATETTLAVNKARENPKTVSEILGHLRIQTTLGLYSDEDLDEMIAAQENFLDAVGFESGSVQ